MSSIKSANIYKLIYDKISLPIIIHINGIIMDANHIAFNYISEECLLGKKIIDFLPDLDEDTFNQRIKQIITKKKHVDYYEKIKFNGKELIVEIQSSYFKFKRKNAIISIINETTERKEIEKKLLINEQKYRAIFTENKSAVLIIDAFKSKISEANNAASNFFELNLQSLNNTFFTDLVDMQVEETINILSAAYKNENNVYRFKHSINKKTIKYSEISFTPLTLNNNEKLYLIIHDISSKIIKEKQVLARNKEFENLLNKIHTGIFKTSVTGNLIDYNYSFYKLFGFENKKSFEKDYLKKIKFSKLIDRIISRYLITDPTTVFKRELRLKIKNGTIIYVSLSAYLNFNKDVPECYGIIHDITHQKNIQNLIFDLNKVLENKVTQKTQKLILLNKQLLKEIDIRKKTQDKLIKSRDFYNSLTNLLPDPLYYYESNSEIYFTNDAFKKTFGDTCIKDLKIYEKILYNDYFFKEREEILEDIHGTSRIFLIKTIKLTSKKTNEETFIGLLRDITERKKIDTSLRKSESKFRKLTESSPNGIFLCNEQGQIEEFNDPLCALIGIPKEEINLKYLWDTIYKIFPLSQEELIAFKTNIKKVLSNGNIERIAKNGKIELKISPPNKPFKYLEITSFTIPTDNGFMFAGIIRDDTIKKNQLLKIRQSNQKLKTIFNNSSGIFLIIDKSFKVFLFNQQAYVFFQKHYKTQLKNNSSILSNLKIREQNEFKKAFDDLNEINYTYLIKRYDTSSTTKWYNFEFTKINNNAYDNERYFINIQDFTEIKRHEETLHQIIKKEKEINEFKTSILSIVAHEFKTPLASINVNSQILLKHLNNLSEIEQQKYFTRIFDSVKIINNIIDDISFYGKNHDKLSSPISIKLDIENFIHKIIREIQFANYSNRRIIIMNNLRTNIIYLDATYFRYITQVSHPLFKQLIY